MLRAHVGKKKKPGLKEDMAYYERLPQGHAEKNYDFLLSATRQYLEHIRNVKAKADRTKAGGRTSAAAAEHRPICFAFQNGSVIKDNHANISMKGVRVLVHLNDPMKRAMERQSARHRKIDLACVPSISRVNV